MTTPTSSHSYEDVDADNASKSRLFHGLRGRSYLGPDLNGLPQRPLQAPAARSSNPLNPSETIEVIPRAYAASGVVQIEQYDVLSPHIRGDSQPLLLSPSGPMSPQKPNNSSFNSKSSSSPLKSSSTISKDGQISAIDQKAQNGPSSPVTSPVVSPAVSRVFRSTIDVKKPSYTSQTNADLKNEPNQKKNALSNSQTLPMPSKSSDLYYNNSQSNLNVSNPSSPRFVPVGTSKQVVVQQQAFPCFIGPYGHVYDKYYQPVDSVVRLSTNTDQNHDPNSWDSRRSEFANASFHESNPGIINSMPSPPSQSLNIDGTSPLSNSSSRTYKRNSKGKPSNNSIGSNIVRPSSPNRNPSPPRKNRSFIGSPTNTDNQSGFNSTMNNANLNNSNSNAKQIWELPRFPDSEMSSASTFFEYEQSVLQWKERIERQLSGLKLPSSSGRHFYRPKIDQASNMDRKDNNMMPNAVSPPGSLVGSPGTETAGSGGHLTKYSSPTQNQFSPRGFEDLEMLAEDDTWDSVIIPQEPNPAYYASYYEYVSAMIRWAQLVNQQATKLPPSASQLPKLLQIPNHPFLSFHNSNNPSSLTPSDEDAPAFSSSSSDSSEDDFQANNRIRLNNKLKSPLKIKKLPLSLITRSSWWDSDHQVASISSPPLSAHSNGEGYQDSSELPPMTPTSARIGFLGNTFAESAPTMVGRFAIESLARPTATAWPGRPSLYALAHPASMEYFASRVSARVAALPTLEALPPLLPTSTNPSHWGADSPIKQPKNSVKRVDFQDPKDSDSLSDSSSPLSARTAPSSAREASSSSSSRVPLSTRSHTDIETKHSKPIKSSVEDAQVTSMLSTQSLIKRSKSNLKNKAHSRSPSSPDSELVSPRSSSNLTIPLPNNPNSPRMKIVKALETITQRQLERYKETGRTGSVAHQLERISHSGPGYPLINYEKLVNGSADSKRALAEEQENALWLGHPSRAPYLDVPYSHLSPLGPATLISSQTSPVSIPALKNWIENILKVAKDINNDSNGNNETDDNEKAPKKLKFQASQAQIIQNAILDALGVPNHYETSKTTQETHRHTLNLLDVPSFISLLSTPYSEEETQQTRKKSPKQRKNGVGGPTLVHIFSAYIFSTDSPSIEDSKTDQKSSTTQTKSSIFCQNLANLLEISKNVQTPLVLFKLSYLMYCCILERPTEALDLITCLFDDTKQVFTKSKFSSKFCRTTSIHSLHQAVIESFIFVLNYGRVKPMEIFRWDKCSVDDFIKMSPYANNQLKNATRLLIDAIDQSYSLETLATLIFEGLFPQEPLNKPTNPTMSNLASFQAAFTATSKHVKTSLAFPLPAATSLSLNALKMFWLEKANLVLKLLSLRSEKDKSDEKSTSTQSHHSEGDKEDTHDKSLEDDSSNDSDSFSQLDRISSNVSGPKIIQNLLGKGGITSRSVSMTSVALFALIWILNVEKHVLFWKTSQLALDDLIDSNNSNSTISHDTSRSHDGLTAKSEKFLVHNFDSICAHFRIAIQNPEVKWVEAVNNALHNKMTHVRFAAGRLFDLCIHGDFYQNNLFTPSNTSSSSTTYSSASDKSNNQIYPQPWMALWLSRLGSKTILKGITSGIERRARIPGLGGVGLVSFSSNPTSPQISPRFKSSSAVKSPRKLKENSLIQSPPLLPHASSSYNPIPPFSTYQWYSLIWKVCGPALSLSEMTNHLSNNFAFPTQAKSNQLTNSVSWIHPHVPLDSSQAILDHISFSGTAVHWDKTEGASMHLGTSSNIDHVRWTWEGSHLLHGVSAPAAPSSSSSIQNNNDSTPLPYLETRMFGGDSCLKTIRDPKLFNRMFRSVMKGEPGPQANLVSQMLLLITCSLRRQNLISPSLSLTSPNDSSIKSESSNKDSLRNAQSNTLIFSGDHLVRLLTHITTPISATTCNHSPPCLNSSSCVFSLSGERQSQYQGRTTLIRLLQLFITSPSIQNWLHSSVQLPVSESSTRLASPEPSPKLETSTHSTGSKRGKLSRSNSSQNSDTQRYSSDSAKQQSQTQQQSQQSQQNESQTSSKRSAKSSVVEQTERSGSATAQDSLAPNTISPIGSLDNANKVLSSTSSSSNSSEAYSPILSTLSPPPSTSTSTTTATTSKGSDKTPMVVNAVSSESSSIPTISLPASSSSSNIPLVDCTGAMLLNLIEALLSIIRFGGEVSCAMSAAECLRSVLFASSKAMDIFLKPVSSQVPSIFAPLLQHKKDSHRKSLNSSEGIEDMIVRARHSTGPFIQNNTTSVSSQSLTMPTTPSSWLVCSSPSLQTPGGIVWSVPKLTASLSLLLQLHASLSTGLSPSASSSLFTHIIDGLGASNSLIHVSNCLYALNQLFSGPAPVSNSISIFSNSNDSSSSQLSQKLFKQLISHFVSHHLFIKLHLVYRRLCEDSTLKPVLEKLVASAALEKKKNSGFDSNSNWTNTDDSIVDKKSVSSPVQTPKGASQFWSTLFKKQGQSIQQSPSSSTINQSPSSSKNSQHEMKGIPSSQSSVVGLNQTPSKSDLRNTSQRSAPLIDSPVSLSLSSIDLYRNKQKNTSQNELSSSFGAELALVQLVSLYQTFATSSACHKIMKTAKSNAEFMEGIRVLSKFVPSRIHAANNTSTNQMPSTPTKSAKSSPSP